MPSILSDSDKETVKRQVPKPANKILAVAVARLYVAYPDTSRWTYTGLQGAAVLCNDLVGRTFWLKLVDVSPMNKGVIWDQEIYDNFAYNQDRTFFHTFELEDCPAGLSFADEKEAKTFIKKMQEREKHASKETTKTPFASTRGQGPAPVANGKGPGRSIFGSLLHRGPAPSASPPAAPAPSIPVAPPAQPPSAPPAKADLPFDINDPSQKGLLDELLQMGITEDQMAEHSDFIKMWIAQKQTAESSAPAEDQRKPRAPPPPPPAPKANAISPQGTGNSTGSRRGPPPPPPARKGRTEAAEESVSPPPREPSPPVRRFAAPPPIADTGKFAEPAGPALPRRPRATSNVNAAAAAPPPPPRPPKTPMDDSQPRFGVPPPFAGDRKVSAPPAPPSRSPIPPGPPPPPPRTGSPASPPPQLPPKVPNTSTPSGPPPPPACQRTGHLPHLPREFQPGLVQTLRLLEDPHRLPGPDWPRSPAAAASSELWCTWKCPTSTTPGSLRAIRSAASTSGASIWGASRCTSAATPIWRLRRTPPPPPAGGAPPPLASTSGGGRDDLMAAIRASGGQGGGGLRKVKETDKKDRSAAMVPGGANESAAASSGGGAPQGGLAGALQDALNKRKKKVSGSGKWSL
ncbi:hypothetical protein N7492_003277 [Penicillium capsulatum]|uniref:Actin associated protein Wsp1 n=1 Tax=Penicillium capsulatum TaxID=69766 RepID=A0A9W9LX84_9EURO|nr:hypothetical protein N7492_003277 [Penicillium capsulatum]